MLKDNLKLLLLGIAIVQMPLVGFSMKPVKKQHATSSVSVKHQHEKSLFSVDQLKNINVIVEDLRNDAFNDEVIDQKKVDDVIKSYNLKFYEAFEKDLRLLLEEFTYNGTKTSVKKESSCYKKAKLCKSNRLETFKAAIKNDDPILLEYAYKNDKEYDEILIKASVEDNKRNCFEFALKKCILTKKERHQQLIEAVLKNSTDVVIKLLPEKGADVNVKNDLGLTPLMYAILKGDTKLVAMLLTHPEIDVNAKDNKGCTALMWAITTKNIWIVAMLLTHPKIDVNEKDDQGCTALMSASLKGYTKLVAMLLSHDKIDVNKKDNEGCTALMLAILMEKTDTVAMLLDRDDIKVNLQNDKGPTALMCAILTGNTEIVEMLLNHADIDVNLKNDKCFTPLMFAILMGNTKIVELLLTHAKIDVNEKDNEGCTALMWAIESNHTEIAELLLKHKGINVDLRDNRGNTALMYAIKYGNIKIIKMLLIKKPNTFGVFSTAIRFNYLELVLELLNHNLKPWEDGYLNIDQTTARLFVRWYTQEDEEEVTINGIIKNGEEKKLSDEDLLKRFDFYLQKKEAGIPEDFARLLKEIINPSQKKPLDPFDTSTEKPLDPFGTSTEKPLVPVKPSPEIQIWELEKAMKGETLHKAPIQKKSESQKKRKTEYKEIKPEEKENNLSFNKVKGFLIVYRFVLTASKRLGKNDFYNGIKVIEDCIKALIPAGIIFVFELNGGNHYQLRVDGTLPEFARELFNSYSKPNVISNHHGSNKVYSDQFNQLISYLIYFMVLVLQQGDKQPGYTECWNQLKKFKDSSQLNIKLLNELYPGIRWVDM